MDKQTLRAITKVEDWRTFEAFVFGLYKQNRQLLDIKKNYKATGVSGRPREVDVLVIFGFAPHILKLGVECKYWSDKVDGDAIDIAVAKRDDLQLDKYAVITTVGFESGAEHYAASKGIDLFLIRVPHDDDFGYSGRFIKLSFRAYGSSIENVGVGMEVLSQQAGSKEAADFAASRLSHIKYTAPGSPEIDHGIDIYRCQIASNSLGGMTISRSDFVENLASLIDKERLKHTKLLYEQNGHTKTAIIRFKSDSCIFLENGAVAHLREIRFDLRYFLSYWKLEIDRAANHPLIIENVIEDTITPLRKDSGQDEFSMVETLPASKIDLSQKPADAIGREGATIQFMYTFPLDPNNLDKSNENYEFRQIGDKWQWVRMDHT